MHLAQANVASMRAGYDDPLMAEFMAQLDAVNATADTAPGFVWRLVEDDDGAEVQRVFGDDKLLFNMSVWKSVEALEDYVYKTRHVDVMRKRAKWFTRPIKPPFALWWIEAGHIPTVEEAKARLEMLWASGPSPDAFTFARRFPAP